MAYIVTGTAGNDALNQSGDTGPGTIIGLAGDDDIATGSGLATVTGDSGNDTVVLQAGNTGTVNGGTENDSIFAGGAIGSMQLFGGDGADTVRTSAASAAQTVIGGNDSADGADSVFTGSGADLILGNGGNDTLNGGSGTFLQASDFLVCSGLLCPTSYTYYRVDSEGGRTRGRRKEHRYIVDAKAAPPALCFVLMPFGRKTDATGRTTDFDAVYQQIIAPAVQQVGLEPIRADEERVGGTIHKPMFERLMLCDYAVADITGANPNVFYELGIRHAMRPRSTVILFAEGTTLPFDIALLRGVPYRTGEQGVPLDAPSCAARVARQLDAARRNPHDDSPLFQLLEYMPRFEVDHSKTDIFRDRFAYSKKYKDRLAAAREQGPGAVNEVMEEPALANLHEVEAGIVVDLFLSLRDVRSYAAMIELFARMPQPLQRARIMREQYAFALNREGRAKEAEAVLKEVLHEFGPSSETNGLLGRVYKDRWEAAKTAGRIEARALLRNAIDTYLAGFQADWRDAFPGVNALTLMEMQEQPDPRQSEILPVVRYAALQKAKRNADYWDHATLLELAVIARDVGDAQDKLADTLASVPATAPWQLETTQRNLRLIREVREKRNEDTAWIRQLEDALADKRGELESART